MVPTFYHGKKGIDGGLRVVCCDTHVTVFSDTKKFEDSNEPVAQIKQMIHVIL